MNRGSLSIMIYPEFSDILMDRLTEIFSVSSAFRILVSDGIILQYHHMERLRKMDGHIQRILTSHQLIKIMGAEQQMDTALIMRSSILDDWGKENTDYVLDTMPLWPLQSGTIICLFLVGEPSPHIRMNHTMGISYFANKKRGDNFRWGETAQRQGRLWKK